VCVCVCVTFDYICIVISLQKKLLTDNLCLQMLCRAVCNAGFVAQVQRIDLPMNGLDVGWCYDDVDIAWMAYSPTQ
jgi:hypothetical protein